MNRPVLGTLFIAAAAMPLAQTSAHAGSKIVDMGVLGGSRSMTGGYSTVNNLGQVVGVSTTAGNAAEHPFRTAPNHAIAPADDIDPLGPRSSVSSLNDAGQAVGSSSFSASESHAYRTAPNGRITLAGDLGSLGAGDSSASGINASGQVVGTSSTNYLSPSGNYAQHAFRTAPNGTINAASDLGAFGGIFGSSFGFAVNDSGQAVGYSTGAGVSHAFRTAPNGGITLASDLGTLGGTYSIAFGINDSGQAVGYAQVSGDAAYHAFRTAPNGVINAASDLGSLGGTSAAVDINASGDVVGYSYTAAMTVPRATFAPAASMLVDLNTLLPVNSGWVLATASGINDVGQISGYGTINGQTHAFLMLVPQAGTYGRGDANFDTRIDFADLVILAQHYNQLNPALDVHIGDFNLDGTTNFADLVALAQHYNTNAASIESLNSESLSADWALARALVPEPTTLANLSLVGVALRRTRRRFA